MGRRGMAGERMRYSPNGFDLFTHTVSPFRRALKGFFRRRTRCAFGGPIVTGTMLTGEG